MGKPGVIAVVAAVLLLGGLDSPEPLSPLWKWISGIGLGICGVAMFRYMIWPDIKAAREADRAEADRRLQTR